MKVRLIRNISRLVPNSTDTEVFAKKGDIVETGPISEKVDWLVGCRHAELLSPEDGVVRHLGEGYDFEIVEK